MLVELIVRLAREKSRWGYVRIQGELRQRGQRVGPSTTRRILRTHKLPPASHRGTHDTWAAYLKAQAGTLISCDFFEVDCAVTLKRLSVFFVIEHATRAVAILGVTKHPTGAWVTQLAREFSHRLGDRAESLRFLIRDRDAKFTESFDAVFASEEIEVTLSAPQCPRMNAIAEQFARTTRETVTDRPLILDERHLRTVMAEWEAHYNTGRAHRAGLACRARTSGNDPTNNRYADDHSQRRSECVRHGCSSLWSREDGV